MGFLCFVTLLSLVSALETLVEQFTCSSGCQSTCIANYTCSSSCKTGYDQTDSSCLTCVPYFADGNTTQLYIPSSDGCISASTVILQESSWLPSASHVETLTNTSSVTLTLTKTTTVYKGICPNKVRYRSGQWYKLHAPDYEKDGYEFTIFKVIKSKKTTNKIYIETSLSMSTDSGECGGRIYIPGDTLEASLRVPILFSESNTEKMVYIFISIEGAEEVTLTVQVVKDDTIGLVPIVTFDQAKMEELFNSKTKTLEVTFPFTRYGKFGYSFCAPTLMVAYITFGVNFKGNYSLLIDTKKQNRLIYLQEFVVDDPDTNIGRCNNIWVGKEYGVQSKAGVGMGIKTKIEQNVNNEVRYLDLQTQEPNTDIQVVFKVICANNCGMSEQHGYCSTDEGKCVCADKYGGDDCHLKCYYNGQWQVPNHSNLCKFGSLHCDQYCGCEEGYTLENEECVSNVCLSNSKLEDEECIRGSEGCLHTCRCMTDYGFSAKNGQCVSDKCGNGVLDQISGANGYIRTEECDNNTNCNEFCYCLEGFEADKNNYGGCKRKDYILTVVLPVVGGAVLVLIVIVVIFIFVIRIVTKNKRVDFDTLKKQQPSYHFYIQGAAQKMPSRENKYIVRPLSLDFGTENAVTDVGETRFERMDIKNYSKNKYMMVIFHTPNNPKYVFHFEPQVLYAAPRLGTRECVVYMTLKCTTKVKEMKIPFTVWFSKSKKTLQQIANVLLDKTFETFSTEDKATMQELCKNVQHHTYYKLNIQTDAASSTHLDMDELNVSEKAFAEGANGKICIGKYRSVPVAVKQFDWDNLTEEEMDDLKKNVIQECNMMSKLRNPFIANYMGSVTYLPQVSMVIQFFVLGSLGEYLRLENGDNRMRLPYKLKIRMLFDTARGMQFLHENQILHLDLKPDNLLVNSLFTESACCIKITDFGTSRFTQRGKGISEKGLGTPIYASPESFKDVYTSAGDVYSFAITAWEVFYQREPYNDFKSLFEIKEYVTNGKRLAIDETMPLKLSSIIQKCWNQATTERPKFDEISTGFVQVAEEALNCEYLDAGINPDDLQCLIASRNKRLTDQLNEIGTE
ncbi:serine-threonine protein kinase, putative [Entamoeba invadens IP1]|uniref:Serine-threonine protein kinase, putative n=1 Tax=Entamoeba invadens IP1 TaxID=370355 RepID=A0A0A1U2N2_ENTIV|nr:serine-threonine protein kinase, putative [Entamoeba invadens IP1]ELP88289.1 serine-threonine protein kinase, putative [Entamoeba invadens IP1]|eukprot:XP_004255060.1 serine-threonine protein kinase, putative [Entamoeba invadens IP1]